MQTLASGFVRSTSIHPLADWEKVMSQIEQFDTLILGSGQGGKLLAWHLARSGQRVAVVERQWVGGSCPAVACLPSKNEIWSARVAHLTRHAANFGVATGPVAVDMAKVRDRKRGMVEREAAFHVQAYASSSSMTAAPARSAAIRWWSTSARMPRFRMCQAWRRPIR
jgi:choline dehydrogenase-like flavoprotein